MVTAGKIESDKAWKKRLKLQAQSEYERGAYNQAIFDAGAIKNARKEERKKVIEEIEAIGITVKIMQGRKEFFPAIEVKDWKRFKKL